jgi:hypothetical protein
MRLRMPRHMFDIMLISNTYEEEDTCVSYEEEDTCLISCLFSNTYDSLEDLKDIIEPFRLHMPAHAVYALARLVS